MLAPGLMPTSDKLLRLGLVGLDTSHVVAFTTAFNVPTAPGHIPGARVVRAWPGGSPDLPPSRDRVEGFTAKLRDDFGVTIVDSPEAVAEGCDALLLTSVDGRVHAEQFARIAPAGLPVFIDKPLAVTPAEAERIAALAAAHGVRWFTSSALRFTPVLTSVLAGEARASVTGAEFSGPLLIQPLNPGYYWYGVHIVEMLYTTFGAGARRVRITRAGADEVAVLEWADGRVGVLRGSPTNQQFQGMVHFAERTVHVDTTLSPISYFPPLAQAILAFFHGAPAPAANAESLEMIRCIDALNRSRDSGAWEDL
jgi:hypothetical protein